MGTPDFAVAVLDSLLDAGHDVEAVFTQPDRPKGRGYEPSKPPVKIEAERHNIAVFQPETLKDDTVYQAVNRMRPDVIVVAAYGKILPENLLKLPRYGCINLHASLLPRYRGAAPVQNAIIRGERISGVTAMQMDKGLDTGDMLFKAVTEIGCNENAGELTGRLASLAAGLIVDTLQAVSASRLCAVSQDHSLSTYAPMITREQCLIDWNAAALEIHNLIRGVYPYLTAIARCGGTDYKVHASAVIEDSVHAQPGQVLEAGQRLIVACGGNTALEILRIQTPGKKVLPARDFLKGSRMTTGTRFDSRAEKNQGGC